MFEPREAALLISAAEIRYGDSFKHMLPDFLRLVEKAPWDGPMDRVGVFWSACDLAYQALRLKDGPG